MKTLATLFLLAASLLLRAADAPADSCNHQLYYTSPAARLFLWVTDAWA